MLSDAERDRLLTGALRRDEERVVPIDESVRERVRRRVDVSRRPDVRPTVAVSVSSQPPDPVVFSTGQPVETTRRSARVWTTIGAAAAVAILIVAGLSSLLGGRSQPEPPQAADVLPPVARPATAGDLEPGVYLLDDFSTPIEFQLSERHRVTHREDGVIRLQPLVTPGSSSTGAVPSLTILDGSGSVEVALRSIDGIQQAPQIVGDAIGRNYRWPAPERFCADDQCAGLFADIAAADGSGIPAGAQADVTVIPVGEASITVLTLLDRDVYVGSPHGSFLPIVESIRPVGSS